MSGVNINVDLGALVKLTADSNMVRKSVSDSQVDLNENKFYFYSWRFIYYSHKSMFTSYVFTLNIT